MSNLQNLSRTEIEAETWLEGILARDTNHTLLTAGARLNNYDAHRRLSDQSSATGSYQDKVVFVARHSAAENSARAGGLSFHEPRRRQRQEAAALLDSFHPSATPSQLSSSARHLPPPAGVYAQLPSIEGAYAQRSPPRSAGTPLPRPDTPHVHIHSSPQPRLFSTPRPRRAISQRRPAPSLLDLPEELAWGPSPRRRSPGPRRAQSRRAACPAPPCDD